MEARAARRDVVVLGARLSALVTGASCIAYATALAEHPRSAPIFAGASAVALVAAVSTLWGWATTTAMIMVAITYGYGLLRAGDGLDAGAPLMGVGLLLIGELLGWARAGGGDKITEREVWRRRTLFLLAMAAAGGATAQFALLVGGSARGTGPALLFFAAVAAVTALIVVLRLVRSLMTGG